MINQSQKIQTLLIAAAMILVGGCAGNTVSTPETMNDQVVETPAIDASSEPEHAENFLLEEWVGPYGGVPAFDRMEIAALKPALEAAMEMNLAEIEVVASNPEPPTFENTIVALERTGDEIG